MYNNFSKELLKPIELKIYYVKLNSFFDLEYEAVFVRQLAPQRWQVIEPLLIDLLDQATEINIAFSWRPRSPDVGDEHIIDCTMNAQAIVITYNRRDFR